MSDKIVAGVAVENSAYSFDIEFQYLLREDMSYAKPGCRVIVPFGNSNKGRQGIITSVSVYKKGEKKLKYISELIDSEPIMNSEMLKLMHILKERTFCTLFDAAKTILPAGLSHRVVASYIAVPESDLSGCDEDEIAIYNAAAESKSYTIGEKLLNKVGMTRDCSILDRMASKGLLERNFDSVRRLGDLTVKNARLSDGFDENTETLDKLTKKQKEIIKVLTDVGTASVKELCYFTGLTPAVVNALEKKGIIEFFDSEIYRTPFDNISVTADKENIVLTDEQERAYNNLVEQLRLGKGGASLLYGVTGSGKTQVYLKLIDYVLNEGKQVIVMVPEIALTPQTLNIFRRRYGDKVAVFHSALSMGQRTDEWKRVKRGEASIAVGTRSAVFAPVENLGLVIIDEEQEHTYKSEQTPRYNAKDVAKFRCAEHGALLLLASATPSIETYANALSGRYSLNRLDKRYSNAKLPEVKIVDMCVDALSESSYFSKALLDKLKSNLESGKQSILLINRRGYNTFVACRSCGHVVTCPSCSISMTYHHANGRLMCHYCGYSQPFTTVCPECGSNDMRYSGYGTQKIEDELSSLLPEARILRLDADSTMSKFSHEKKLNDFENKKYDILLGTQMVAKGLDFENVTLVGVINADQQLNNDDFRSQERTFDLLTQVVGRAGRGEYKGTAIIQTMNPENEIIRIAAQQNYDKFYDTEINMRKMLIYPPYCDICLVGFVGTNESKVNMSSKLFFDKLKNKLSDEFASQKVIILGPMTARVSKISNKFRYRIIIKCKNSKDFRRMISDLLKEFAQEKNTGDTSVYIDINPETIL
ncbi:MAG: primosomal protein N' [Clostridia bacterium]|nr:primosomal protein N' [Clostridia bacterium]